jgi:hypothetical protein
MLSSIHPLGERARNNKWWLTVGSFTVAAIVVGSVFGAALGAVGGLAFDDVSTSVILLVVAAAAVTAGVLDLMRVAPPGPTRQVNEHWIGRFRGWVYGAAFGAELGVGTVTYVVTWGIYALYVTEIATRSPMWGALIGGLFGLGRSLALLLAGVVDRPSRLTEFHRRMSDLGPTFHRGAAVGLTTIGVVLALGATL